MSARQREANEVSRAKTKERLLNKIAGVSVSGDGQGGQVAVLKCQCHNLAKHACSVCRQAPAGHDSKSDSAMKALVNRAKQKPWTLPAAQIRAALDRVHCATCRTVLHYRLLESLRSGTLKMGDLEWRPSARALAASALGSQPLIVDLESVQPLPEARVRELISALYASKPEYRHKAVVTVRHLDKLAPAAPFPLFGASGYSSTRDVGRNGHGLLPVGIADVFEVNFFKALEDMHHARRMVEVQIGILNYMPPMAHFARGPRESPQAIASTKLQILMQTLQKELEQYADWYNVRQETSPEKATSITIELPSVDLDSLGGGERESTDLAQTVAVAHDLWVKGLTDLHRASLAVVEFLSFVDAQSKADCAAAAADEEIARHALREVQADDGEMLGYAPGRGSLQAGSIRRAALEAAKRELSEIDTGKPFTLKDLATAVGKGHGCGAEIPGRDEESGQAGPSSRLGAMDRFSLSHTPNGLSSASGVVGGNSAAVPQRPGGRRGEAGLPPDRYLSRSSEWQRIESGDQWIPGALRFFTELGEYAGALLQLTVEAVSNDLTVQLEAMAKRRLGKLLTFAELDLVLHDNRSKHHSGRRLGQDGEASVLRRRRAIAAQEFNSNEDMLRADGRLPAVGERRAALGGVQMLAFESESGDKDKDADDKPSMSRESLLGWQQVLLLRARNMCRARGLGALMQGHLDALTRMCGNYNLSADAGLSEYWGFFGHQYACETSSRRTVMTLQKSSMYLGADEFTRVKDQDQNTLQMFQNETQFSAVPVVDAKRYTPDARQNAVDCKVYTAPEWSRREVCAVRISLERLTSVYGPMYDSLRGIFREASGRIAASVVPGMPRSSAADGTETEPLLGSDECDAFAQGYVPLRDNLDFGYSQSEEEGAEEEWGHPTGHVPSMLPTAGLTGHLNATAKTSPLLLKYLDMDPVREAYEVLLTLTKKSVTATAMPFLSQPGGDMCDSAAYEKLSAQLFAAAGELVHRMATLRARVAAVASQKDSGERVPWLQPPPGLPNLTALSAGDVASGKGSDERAGGRIGDGLQEIMTREQWELRTEEDVECARHRRQLVWGEHPVAEVPLVPDIEAPPGAASTDPPVSPFTIPLLEPEALALLAQLEGALRTAASRLQNLPTIITPGLGWLKDYAPSSGDYDSSLAERLGMASSSSAAPASGACGLSMSGTRMKRIDKTWTEDQNLNGRQQDVPSLKIRLDELWKTTEEAFLEACAAPLTGSRWYPQHFSTAKVLYMNNEFVADAKSKAEKERRKAAGDKLHQMNSMTSLAREYTLFESQVLKLDALARDEGSRCAIPVVNAAPDYESWASGVNAEAKDDAKRRGRSEFHVETRELLASPYLAAPSGVRPFWYEPSHGSHSLVVQQTTNEHDDRERVEKELSYFLPRASGVIQAHVWPPEVRGERPDSSNHVLQRDGQPRWTSTAVVTQAAPGDFLELAARVDDTAKRTAYIWGKLLTRLVSVYSHISKAWYALATHVAAAPYRRITTCLNKGASDAHLSELLREALHRDLQQAATDADADALAIEEENEAKEKEEKEKARKAKKEAKEKGKAAAQPPLAPPAPAPTAQVVVDAQPMLVTVAPLPAPAPEHAGVDVQAGGAEGAQRGKERAAGKAKVPGPRAGAGPLGRVDRAGATPSLAVSTGFSGLNAGLDDGEALLTAAMLSRSSGDDSAWEQAGGARSKKETPSAGPREKGKERGGASTGHKAVPSGAAAVKKERAVESQPLEKEREGEAAIPAQERGKGKASAAHPPPLAVGADAPRVQGGMTKTLAVPVAPSTGKPPMMSFAAVTAAPRVAAAGPVQPVLTSGSAHTTLARPAAGVAAPPVKISAPEVVPAPAQGTVPVPADASAVVEQRPVEDTASVQADVPVAVSPPASQGVGGDDVPTGVAVEVQPPTSVPVESAALGGGGGGRKLRFSATATVFVPPVIPPVVAQAAEAGAGTPTGRGGALSSSPKPALLGGTAPGGAGPGPMPMGPGGPTSLAPPHGIRHAHPHAQALMYNQYMQAMQQAQAMQAMQVQAMQAAALSSAALSIQTQGAGDRAEVAPSPTSSVPAGPSPTSHAPSSPQVASPGRVQQGQGQGSEQGTVPGQIQGRPMHGAAPLTYQEVQANLQARYMQAQVQLQQLNMQYMQMQMQMQNLEQQRQALPPGSALPPQFQAMQQTLQINHHQCQAAMMNVSGQAQALLAQAQGLQAQAAMQGGGVPQQAHVQQPSGPPYSEVPAPTVPPAEGVGAEVPVPPPPPSTAPVTSEAEKDKAGAAPATVKKAWSAVAGTAKASFATAVQGQNPYTPTTANDALLAERLSAAENADVPSSGEGEWELQGGKKDKERCGGGKGAARYGKGGEGDKEGQASAPGSGLDNRYGANNCYLNTVVQSLFRLAPFRTAALARYPALVEAYKGPRPGEKASPRDRAAADLLASLLTTLRSMSSSASEVASVEGLKRALVKCLLARAEGAHGVTGARTAKAMSEGAMGDASEALEEVVTLAHEAEVTVKRALARGSSGLQEADLALELTEAGPAPSVALDAFGMMWRDSAACGVCGESTAPVPVTGLGLHVNVHDLLAAVNRRGAQESHGAHFDDLLRSVWEGGDARSCSAGHGPFVQHRSLRRWVNTLTVVLGWASARESPAAVAAVLGTLDGLLDLRAAFHGIVGEADAGVPPLPARLRGMICYTDLHWVAFFDTSVGAGALPAWVCANDETVNPVTHPASECRAHGLQPSVLFFEPLGPGDPLPASRGRAALHGTGAGPPLNAAAVAAASPSLPRLRAARPVPTGAGSATEGGIGAWGDLALGADMDAGSSATPPSPSMEQGTGREGGRAPRDSRDRDRGSASPGYNGGGYNAAQGRARPGAGRHVPPPPAPTGTVVQGAGGAAYGYTDRSADTSRYGLGGRGGGPRSDRRGAGAVTPLGPAAWTDRRVGGGGAHAPPQAPA